MILLRNSNPWPIVHIMPRYEAHFHIATSLTLVFLGVTLGVFFIINDGHNARACVRCSTFTPQTVEHVIALLLVHDMWWKVCTLNMIIMHIYIHYYESHLKVERRNRRQKTFTYGFYTYLAIFILTHDGNWDRYFTQ